MMRESNLSVDVFFSDLTIGDVKSIDNDAQIIPVLMPRYTERSKSKRKRMQIPLETKIRMIEAIDRHKKNYAQTAEMFGLNDTSVVWKTYRRKKELMAAYLKAFRDGNEKVHKGVRLPRKKKE